MTITRNCAGMTFEPLRRLLADHMHRGAATRAIGVFRRDRHVDMRQMPGKRAAAGAALVGARAGARRVLLVVGRRVAGNRLLDVLDRQKQLLGIELLRAPAELRALQLTQQIPQAIHLRQRLIALGDCGVPLRLCRGEERLQRFDVGRKLICDRAHARYSI